MKDIIEFYLVGEYVPFLRIESSHTPVAGNMINIDGLTYRVAGVSFSVDRRGRTDQMRCNVICEVQR